MEAIITCLKSNNYKIYDASLNKTYKAKASGIFRHQGLTPIVGDKVKYQLMNDDEAYIIEIFERFNELIRPPIANINQALVIFSVKEPSLNTNLLDRFLAILEFNNIETIIIFTKWDLLSPNEIDMMDSYYEYYQNIGYQVIKTSTKISSDIAKISDIIKGKVSVITGQSGVGKSSLLNYLYPNLNIKTDEISHALGRGKHTTRHVELIKIEEGWVADSPGFGNIEFLEMTEVDVAHSFKEFFNLSSKCHYNGCLHQNEPGCEVKKMMNNSDGNSLKIYKGRYENYLQIIQEIKKQKKW